MRPGTRNARGNSVPFGRRHCLRRALNDDPRLDQQFIEHLATTSSDRRNFEHSTIASAVDALTNEQRVRLVDGIKPGAMHTSRLVTALVGDSPDIYSTLLNNDALKPLWGVPLGRKPDAVWTTFVAMAIQKGVADQEIVDHTRTVLSGFGPIPEKCHREIEAWTSCRETAKGPVLRVVEAGLGEAQDELDYWEASHRQQEL